jgi:hypothetical protein
LPWLLSELLPDTISGDLLVLLYDLAKQSFGETLECQDKVEGLTETICKYFLKQSSKY